MCANHIMKVNKLLQIHGNSAGRIPPKKLFGFRIWRIFYADLRILLIQRIADLSNILSRIVDFACNLVRILDCDFIVELFADPNLNKTFCIPTYNTMHLYSDGGFCFKFGRICIPLFTPLPNKENLSFIMNSMNLIQLRS